MGAGVVAGAGAGGWAAILGGVDCTSLLAGGLSGAVFGSAGAGLLDLAGGGVSVGLVVTSADTGLLVGGGFVVESWDFEEGL